MGADTDDFDPRMIASTMLNLGFRFKYQKEDVMAEMAKLLFDCDTARIKLGLPTPQELLMYLNSQDPMQVVPDPAGKLPSVFDSDELASYFFALAFPLTKISPLSLCLPNKFFI